jgi:predicted RNA-binding Zn-ribbon protein involved in translation (DUF1610 family)
MTPIDMLIFCPNCGEQHIDAPEDWESYGYRVEAAQAEGRVIGARWDNPPHRSHKCGNCGHIWRHADVPTNGVRAIETKGRADSPIVTPPRVRGRSA